MCHFSYITAVTYIGDCHLTYVPKKISFVYVEPSKRIITPIYTTREISLAESVRSKTV